MKLTSNSTLDILNLLVNEKSPYVWAAIMANGEIVCMSCAHAHYPHIHRATLNPDITTSSWRVIGFINNNWDSAGRSKVCSHCSKTLWVQP